jgi:TetR/AcrR family transcriptional repressor of nem operon
MSRLNTTDTKERLLETAMELISAESYGAVSVDDICAKAKVKKGSFYHFFPSKCDLAVAAFENAWQTKLRPELDQIFSTQVSPLKRLTGFFEFVYKMQKEKQERYGFVCGCPYTSVGSEQGTQDQKLRKEIEHLFDLKKKYVESALQDALREKQIPECDAKEKANEIFAFYLGVLTQAKITNSLEPLTMKKIRPALFRILEVDAAKVAA